MLRLESVPRLKCVVIFYCVFSLIVQLTSVSRSSILRLFIIVFMASQQSRAARPKRKLEWKFCDKSKIICTFLTSRVYILNLLNSFMTWYIEECLKKTKTKYNDFKEQYPYSSVGWSLVIKEIRVRGRIRFRINSALSSQNRTKRNRLKSKVYAWMKAEHTRLLQPETSQLNYTSWTPVNFFLFTDIDVKELLNKSVWRGLRQGNWEWWGAH